jgi:transcriptional regulator with XRE-family HTH domain
MMQKEVASVAEMQASNYSKIESGKRDISLAALDKLTHFFGITVNEVIHFEDAKTPSPIKVEDKTANEKVQLISQLDEEDKHAVYRIIDGMLTKNKFQTFFEQNIQTAK